MTAEPTVRPAEGQALPSAVGGLPVAGAAGLVALGALGSRVLGLIREPAAAYYFGRTNATDSYFVASTLSTLVYDLLVSGVVGAALIPVLSRLAARDDRDELWDVASAVMTLACVILAATTALLMLFAPALVYVMQSGATVEDRDLTVLLARVMMPTIFFMGLSAVSTATLYSIGRYSYGALSVVCVNLGVVAGLVMLHRLGIVSAALGLLCGTMAQLGIQLIGLARARARLRPRLLLRHPEVLQIGKLYAPVALSFVLTGALTILDRNLYSHVGAGTLSASQYATRLVQVPLGLVATALSMAILPTLSRYAARTDLGPYRRMVSTGIAFATLLILPATVALVVLRMPAVALLFQRGHFNAADTSITALAFLLYAPQMPFVAVDQVALAAFYAMHDTRTPVVVMVVSGALYVLVALGFVAQWGMAALILASTLQNISHAVILVWLLARRVGFGDERQLVTAMGRIAAAGAVMAAVCVVAARAVGAGISPSASWQPLVTLVVAGGAGTAAYVTSVWLARVPEAQLAWSVMASRWRRAVSRA